jgi:hypothetical protein
MFHSIQFANPIPFVKNSLSRPPLRRGFLLMALALAWFGLSPTARAVSPPPDGGYPNQNTAEGEDALFSLTTGVNNTAIGFQALFNNTTGNHNTANGASALANNTTGSNNTANGGYALISNTTGVANTANGFSALFNNTTANNNTAMGFDALLSNTTGNDNTATGVDALLINTTGNNNTANGIQTLSNNTTGNSNTANGWQALVNNTIGSFNIAVGAGAGVNLTTGNSNINIGNPGVAGESRTTRIGSNQRNTFIAGISGVTVPNGVGVIINPQGHLGTVVSSERFKEEIQPMEKASEAIHGLKPVTFRYKHELDPEGTPQFGLVAEQVEKVNPDLVARDADGKAYTVRYEAVNAMLLNEFLKEHRKVEKLEATTAEQQQEIKGLIARLEKQESQIRKVSAQLAAASPSFGGLEVSRPAQQTVVTNE